MPPKTKMTPEEVEQKLRDEPFSYCLGSMHYVNVFGECPCGTFREGDELREKVLGIKVKNGFGRET